jgi:hypothetical protein
VILTLGDVAAGLAAWVAVGFFRDPRAIVDEALPEAGKPRSDSRFGD